MDLLRITAGARDPLTDTQAFSSTPDDRAFIAIAAARARIKNPTRESMRL